MKPRVFRWIDALTFGLAAFLVLMVAIGVSVTHQVRSMTTADWIATWGVAGVFVGAYVLILAMRWRWVQQIEYEVDGLQVISHGLVERGAVECEVARTIMCWVPALMAEAKLTGEQARAVTRRAFAGVMLVWMPFPFAYQGRKLYAGLAMPGNAVLVGAKLPLVESALGHELGHLILAAWGVSATDEMLLGLSRKHGVPF